MSDYQIVQVGLETINYSLRIFKIPEAEVNDKLTYFTREKGFVSKFLYEDFIIVSCVPEIHQFLQHLKQLEVNRDEFFRIRNEVIAKILEVNPPLIPANIVINKNNVVKTKMTADKDSTSLMDNPHWMKDPSTEVKAPLSESKSLDKDKLQIKDLNFTKNQQYWRRIGQYIIIKGFDAGCEAVILGNKQFNTRHSFEQYIVAICVDEVEDLLLRVEKMNLRISPPILVHELYEICKKVNPSLDYDLYKDLITPKESDDDAPVDPFASFNKTVGDVEEDAAAQTQDRGRVKTFKTIKKEKLLSLDVDMKKKVIGQEKALDSLVEAIQRSSVGLRDPNQPIGSFIFTGFTGVGKTYASKVLAEELIGTRNGLVVIDCSEYSADHEYAKLIGAPSGYIGHDQGGYLTNAVKKNPFSVVLFDEIEKASDKVHQLMLQIMDEARLTDGRGHAVSFRDTIIVMTSNLGVKEMQNVEHTIGFGGAAQLTKDKREKAISEALKNRFRPEFLNRVTLVVHFDALSKSDYLKIIKLELEKLKKNLKLNQTEYSKLDLKFDKSLYNYIYTRGIDEKLGARPLLRVIEQEVSTPLARKLLKDVTDCSSTSITVSAKNDKVVIDSACVVKKDADVDTPPFFMTAGANNECNE